MKLQIFFFFFSLTTVAAILVERLPTPPMYFMLPLLFSNNLQKSHQDALQVDIYPVSQHFLYKGLCHPN
jgi:hypothetical protein